MKKTNILLSLLIVVILVFTSCEKIDNENYQNISMENLSVPDNFNWKTTKKYSVEIESNINGILKIEHENSTFLKIYIFSNENHYSNLELPSYLNHVYLSVNNKKIKYDLYNDEIKYNFN